nr:polypyrimidine tract-binding protein homolog 3 isoform X1 [Tanacetum cinerariifolium]
MASGGSDQNAEYAPSKLLQLGTVAEYESEFVILANQVTGISANLLKSFYITGLKLELQWELFRSKPTTLGEAFSSARIANARFEDERSTIAISKPNELTAHVQDLEQTTRGRGDEPNRILLVTIHDLIYPITVEVLNQIFTSHGATREPRRTHLLLLCFSILNVEEAHNTKSPLSVDTYGNNGVDESETSGPETSAKEVVDNANGSALICLVGYDTRSEVVIGLPEEFREGDMVDALSRVLEQKSSEKEVDSGSERRDYALFRASLSAFLNLGPGSFAHRRIWDPEINISSRQHLEGKVVVKEWGMIHTRDQNARYALSKLLQRGRVAEYERKAFFKARITEACFEDENNQAVDTNIGDPDVKDKQEVKKADDQEIENIKDKEDKIVEDQQVSEADDDTNNDNFGCSLPPHKGVDLTVEGVVFENIKSDLKKDEDEQGKKNNKGIITFFEVGANKVSKPNGVFNDVGGVGYSKADGKWEPARGIKDGWYLFDELGS